MGMRGSPARRVVQMSARPVYVVRSSLEGCLTSKRCMFDWAKAGEGRLYNFVNVLRGFLRGASASSGLISMMAKS